MSTQLQTQRGIITVRQATPADAAQVRDIRLEALASHPEAFGADYAMSEAEPVASWADRIAGYAGEEQGVLSVACAEEQIIGLMGLVRGKWPKSQHSGTMWGAYVNAAWRGLSIADALIDECLAWARDHGVNIVKLAVVTSNAAAIRCYTRNGFILYGTEPQAIYYDGIFYDELLMARSLSI